MPSLLWGTWSGGTRSLSATGMDRFEDDINLVILRLDIQIDGTIETVPLCMQPEGPPTTASINQNFQKSVSPNVLRFFCSDHQL